MVKSAPGAGDGGGVGKHAHATRDLGEVTTRNMGGGLVADTELEASRAPVDELDGPLGLDDRNGSVDILGDDVSTVEESAGHVLALARVALDHLVTRLEARESHVGDRVLLVVGLLGGDDGGEGGEREVDTREAIMRIVSMITANSKCRGTYGTKLVWNSLRSTFREPSKRKEAVIEETTWAINLLRLVKLGEAMLRFFLQMS